MSKRRGSAQVSNGGPTWQTNTGGRCEECTWKTQVMLRQVCCQANCVVSYLKKATMLASLDGKVACQLSEHLHFRPMLGFA